ncbi:nucleotide sugar dehydrogenase [Mycobacterium sp. 236(2023)]|uniref:nucleotide sugar dehydrogenase n=1 Tax=Mycobacterium sp. 236(2023) TaxID=3038163 RepID=UPI0024158201|nr:nucleotide sugar dehydrogenase [Mycobacterium sp. 236(2023)]MDG4664932.1 nucleotide sugar dehydrogenase [Mycobacterium sp. 236(2023)]
MTVQLEVTTGETSDEFSSSAHRDHPLVAIVGLGYVGLPTALSFTTSGADVIGFDVSEARLLAIKADQVDLLARDHTRLASAFSAHQLSLTTEASGIAAADAVLICVPTPVDAHLTPDLEALSSACATVVQNARPGQTIVLTSTTYPGCTADLLVRPLQARGFQVGTDIFVAFSPERIDPGVVDHAPDRTPRVIGGVTAECARRAASFLAHTAGSLHMVSSPEAAEMTKLVENTFRAVNIALANEFADAAREVNIDVMEVISAAATKPYGFMPFYPGAGVGGHCIPCDPHYLLWQLRARRTSSPVVASAMTAIAERPRDVVTRSRDVLADAGRRMRDARILVLGVTYKPAVADVRESPALAIIDMLAAEGAHVAFADPHVELLQTPSTGLLTSHPRPAEETWDLVLVHTIQPGEEYGWLADQPLVLDTTYRMGDLAPHVTL